MKNLLYILLLLPFAVTGQTPTQDINYVKTSAYREPTQTGNQSLARHSVTYYDGLGRPIQQVAGKASSTGKDIITYMEYDRYNRQPKEYLPYEAGTSALEFDYSAKTNTHLFYNAPAYENTPNPYSRQFFEASPLNRVLKQGAPGIHWDVDTLGNNDRAIKYGYRTNVSSDNVKRLRAQANYNNATKIYDITFYNEGNYAAGQLYKTITQDENKQGPIDAGTLPVGKVNTTEEYKNREGQVVLKRHYNLIVEGNNISAEILDTYYVYDQFGNLTYVIPPLANGQFEEGLCYHYKYDHRNRLVEKKLPGKKWEYMVYDATDRLVAAGPVPSPFGTPGQEGWMYTYYDKFNRPVMTGWIAQGGIGTAARNTLQSSHNNTPVSLQRATAPVTVDGIGQGYNLSSPITGFKLLTVNYYDNYTWPGGPGTPTTAQQVEGQALLAAPRSLATGSWIRILTGATDTTGETAYTFYDNKGRPVRSYIANYLGGYTQTDSKLDFDGTVQYTLATHKYNASADVLTTREDFTYTPEDRLVLHTHKINNLPAEQMSYNSYRELGELEYKYVGGVAGVSALQKVDFTYNVRGWLKGINDISNLNSASDGDLFAFKINYNDLLDEDINGQVQPLYNGNIAETYWRSANDDIQRSYGYKYDNLNRLTDAWYQKPQSAVPVPGSYNEHISYDKNGNITTLQRTGDLDNAVFTIETDNLAYNYLPANPNRLMRVTDSTNHPAGFKDGDNTDDDFAYDDYGNMTVDQNKGITGITYNHMNLPVEIIFYNDNSRKINYLYNAAGGKLKKTVTTQAGVTTTEYMGGYQYTNAELDFIATAEGYVKIVSPGKPYESHNYVYHYKDHLGNVRLSYTFDTAQGELTILEENNYYPFGLKHENYNIDLYMFVGQEGNGGYYTAIQPMPHGQRNTYQYKYNGKEYQDELGLNMYDYGARNYDPAIGRWMNIDPLAETSRRWTPYNYCYNNPVYFIDPDGMEGVGHLSALGADIANVRTLSLDLSHLGPKTKGADKKGRFQTLFENLLNKPSDHWRLNSSGRLELIRKTNDNFNVFFDEKGNKLFQTNVQSKEITTRAWAGKTEEYQNKFKQVFIQIAEQFEVYTIMQERAIETGFDEKFVSISQMKQIGENYERLGTKMAALSFLKETPKWGVGYIYAGASSLFGIGLQATKSVYTSQTGTDLMKDSSSLINQGINNFGNFIENLKTEFNHGMSRLSTGQWGN